MTPSMSYRSRPVRASSVRGALGVSPREMRVLVAVMAHERAFGRGPTAFDVECFLNLGSRGNSRAVALVRLGWLTLSHGRTPYLSATSMCWRAFGFVKVLQS